MIARDAVLEETEFLHEPRFPVGSMEIRNTVRRAAEAALPTELIFAIVQREDDRLVGRTKLKNLDLVHRCAETGTRLYRPEHRGMGYGTEAKHLILGYAFEVLNLPYALVAGVGWQSALAGRRAETGIPPGGLERLPPDAPRYPLQ